MARGPAKEMPRSRCMNPQRLLGSGGKTIHGMGCKRIIDPCAKPGKAFTILGIDPGLAATGIGILRISRGTPTEAAYDCIATKAGKEFTKRLVEIHSRARAIIRMFKPDVMAIERLFFSRNVKTAMYVGQAMGVVKLAAGQAGVPVFEYTPMEVKQSVTGRGMGDKREVASMVARLLGLDRVPKPDDAADALAIAYCHFASMRMDSRS